VVLRDIIMARRRYFQELLAARRDRVEHSRQQTEAARSRGMITRRRDPAQARRVIYEPTGKLSIPASNDRTHLWA